MRAQQKDEMHEEVTPFLQSGVTFSIKESGKTLISQNRLREGRKSGPPAFLQS